MTKKGNTTKIARHVSTGHNNAPSKGRFIKLMEYFQKRLLNKSRAVV